jgi:hypothetical protein
MKAQKKVTNERGSEYKISIAIPFSVDKLSKPQKKPRTITNCD